MDGTSIINLFMKNRVGNLEVCSWLLETIWTSFNVDASAVNNGKHIGVGAVIQDHRGFIHGIMPRAMIGRFSPYVAEFIALLEGLIFDRQEGLMIHIADSCTDGCRCSS